MRFLFLPLLAAAIFLLDYLSKAYVLTHIPPMLLSVPIYPYGGIPIFQDWHGIDFSINLVMNKGTAWGLFAEFQQWLLYLRIAVIGGLLSYLLFFNKTPSHRIPFTLILSGAVSNVVDTLKHGFVVDMFYFKFWDYSYPVFNVADGAIFCGLLWMFFLSLFNKAKSASKSIA